MNYKVNDRVVVNSGGVKNVSGTVRAVSRRTGGLTVNLDRPAGTRVNVMPYEVQPLVIDTGDRHAS